ncbi:hypothetical protein RJ640_020349 [Escallonia rubra]|uniref:Cytochrome P450 n=1 Tax=Escallonia rubra TaxID=112253 RepID=A0AA88U5H8_9ASTE|nr:hypothetical protein RJ640_020349 [Escallonia rubra]
MEMKQWFGSLVANMVVKLIAGKRFSHDDEEGERFQKAIRKFIELLGAFVLGDVVPYLRWLDFGGYEKAMKEIAKEIDYILQGWLEEHKMKRTSRQHIKGEEQDFMDVMLSIFDGASPEDLAGFDADTVNKATCLINITDISMLRGSNKCPQHHFTDVGKVGHTYPIMLALFSLL